MDPGIGPLFYSNPWVLRMQCKNVEKTTFIIFTQFKKMHTQSFTIPHFPKIGLTHKNSPQWSRQLSQPTLLRASEVRLTGASSEGGKCTESPRTFIYGKHRKNRRKPVMKNIPDSGVVFTFEEGINTSHVCLKGKRFNFRIVWNCVPKLLFLFYFWGRQKRGSCSYVPSIEEEIRPT